MTYHTIEATARALLDADGCTDPVTVLTHGPSGTLERDISLGELRRLGAAVTAARESPTTITDEGYVRMLKELNGFE